MVVVFHEVEGTQQGPWLFVDEPSGLPVHTAFMLAIKCDQDGRIVDQWVGSNFVEMLLQLGWASRQWVILQHPRTD